MVNFPTKQELKELQDFKEPFCLTIYAPFVEANAATNPNRIELKNLLKEAKIALDSAGVKEKDVEATLQPARDLVAKLDEFWPIHKESLVLFLHPRMFRYYHIQNKIPYELTVETGFNLKPLLAGMHDDKKFYVLSLNHNKVQLYEGGHYGLRPLDLDNFPSNLRRTLHIDEYPDEVHAHMAAPAGSSTGEAFFGTSNQTDTDKTYLLEFFRRIDKRLHKFFIGQDAPLILAGAEFLLPIYRKANHYPHVLDEEIRGNIEHENLEDIHKKAWAIINSHFIMSSNDKLNRL